MTKKTQNSDFKEARSNNLSKEDLTAREVELHDQAVEIVKEFTDKLKALHATLVNCKEGTTSKDRTEGLAAMIVVQPYTVTKNGQKSFGAASGFAAGVDPFSVLESPLVQFFTENSHTLELFSDIEDSVRKNAHGVVMQDLHGMLGDMLKDMGR